MLIDRCWGRRGGTSCRRAGRPHISGPGPSPELGLRGPLGAPQASEPPCRRGSALQRRPLWAGGQGVGHELVQGLTPGPGCRPLGTQLDGSVPTAGARCLPRFPSLGACAHAVASVGTPDTCLPSHFSPDRTSLPLWRSAQQQMPGDALLARRPALPAHPGAAPRKADSWSSTRGRGLASPGGLCICRALLPGPHLPEAPGMGGWGHLAHLS